MCSGDPDYVESNAYEDELVASAEAMWQDFQENYVPLENERIDRIRKYGSDAHKQLQTDKAVTSARINTPTGVTAGLGMDPTSGTFLGATGTSQSQAGLAGSLGAVSGLQTAKDQYVGGMMGLAQTGRGQQSTALSGTSSLASMQAGQDAAAIAAQQTADSARLGAIGSIAGMGVTYGHSKDWWQEPKKGAAGMQ